MRKAIAAPNVVATIMITEPINVPNKKPALRVKRTLGNKNTTNSMSRKIKIIGAQRPGLCKRLTKLSSVFCKSKCNKSDKIRPVSKVLGTINHSIDEVFVICTPPIKCILNPCIQYFLIFINIFYHCIFTFKITNW